MTAHLFNQREQRALFVGLDLETTSTDASRAHIVQFASVAQCPGFLPPEGSVANFLLDPGCAIPPLATAVHGITDEMVRDKLTFDQNLPQLMKLLHMATQPGAIVTGYNVRRYDWALLQHALAERGIILPTPTFVDVCDLIGWYYRHLPSRKLTAVAEHLGVGFFGAANGKQGAQQSGLQSVQAQSLDAAKVGHVWLAHPDGKGDSIEAQAAPDSTPTDRAHDALGDVNKTFQVLAKICHHLELSDDMAGDIELIRLAQLAAIRVDAEYGQYQHYIYRDRERWDKPDAPFRLGMGKKHCGKLLTDLAKQDPRYCDWFIANPLQRAPAAVWDEFKRAGIVFATDADRERLGIPKGGAQ